MAPRVLSGKLDDLFCGVWLPVSWGLITVVSNISENSDLTPVFMCFLIVLLNGVASGSYHNGLLRFSVNDENIMLKLMLILSSPLLFGSTECCK